MPFFFVTLCREKASARPKELADVDALEQGEALRAILNVGYGMLISAPRFSRKRARPAQPWIAGEAPVEGNPFETIFNGQCGMKSIGYQISPDIGGPAEFQKNLPVACPGTDDGDLKSAS